MVAGVADAHLRSAVAGIRGLGAAGVPLVALGPHRGAAGMRSRYATATARVPDPQVDLGGYRSALEHVAAEHDGLLLYPSSEAGLAPLLDEPLPQGVELPFANRAAAAQLRDKSALPRLAEAAGLTTPSAYAVGRADQVARADLEFPLVLKPAVAPAKLGTARVVHSPSELASVLADLDPGDQLLAQRLVHGDAVSLALVVDRDGAVVARFQERVLRTWPAEAGSFALTQSEHPDPGLFEHARELLRAAGYSGLAQLDLLVTADGLVLLDANPRFYACLPTALRAGVNLPAAWHSVATEGSAPAQDGYRVGVRFRWLEGDLSAAFGGMPGRLALRPQRLTAGAMWQADDPLASVALAREAVTSRIHRRLPWR